MELNIYNGFLMGMTQYLYAVMLSVGLPVQIFALSAIHQNMEFWKSHLKKNNQQQRTTTTTTTFTPTNTTMMMTTTTKTTTTTRLTNDCYMMSNFRMI
jgi:hypothetical protein